MAAHAFVKLGTREAMTAASPDPILERLVPATYRRSPWKNGKGVTVDIAGAHRQGADPQKWDGLVWRLGRTRIEAPSPFSDLSGQDRILTVIEGRGLILKPRGRPNIDAREPFRPVAFPGEWPIEAELEQGGVGVLNLIWDRRLARGAMRFPKPGDTLALEGDVHLLHASAGKVTFVLGGRDIALGHDHALRLAGVATLRHSAGRLAVASITLLCDTTPARGGSRRSS
jgi:environmental stress-induced protein Ves